jgi:hypothetical protein
MIESINKAVKLDDQVFMIDFLERRRPAGRRHYLFVKFKNLIIE